MKFQSPIIALSFCIPLLFCQCGGDDPEAGGGGGGGAGDAIEMAKAGAFPTDGIGELGEALKGKTWGEMFEGVAEEPAEWASEPLPDDSPDKETHEGVRVQFPAEGEKIWVLLKVAKDGSAVTPLAAGSGDRKGTADPVEITGVIASKYAMNSKDLADHPVILKIRARAIGTKNINNLKQFSLQCMLSATENSGLYPKDFASVKAAMRVELKVTDPKTGDEVDPIYFPGLTNTSKSDTVLFACPFVNPDETRTVAYVDGAVEHLSEEEYQKKTKAVNE